MVIVLHIVPYFASQIHINVPESPVMVVVQKLIHVLPYPRIPVVQQFVL
jgi:hypothetical protein